MPVISCFIAPLQIILVEAVRLMPRYTIYPSLRKGRISLLGTEPTSLHNCFDVRLQRVERKSCARAEAVWQSSNASSYALGPPRAGGAPASAGCGFGRKLKLTRHQVAEALARREAGEMLTEIARSYNVSHPTIGRLRPEHLVRP
jgi:hypothetical protein